MGCGSSAKGKYNQPVGDEAVKPDGAKPDEAAKPAPPAATTQDPKVPSKEPPAIAEGKTPSKEEAPKAAALGADAAPAVDDQLQSRAQDALMAALGADDEPTEEAPVAAPAAAPVDAPAAATEAPVEAKRSEICEDEKAKIDAMKNRGHREGVSAASISPEDLANFVKPVYEKTEAESAKLSTVLSSNAQMKVLAGCLEGDSLKDVINAFFLKEVENGKDVIRQGDEGDCLYICEQGELEVFVSRPDPLTGVQSTGKGSKVLSVGPGALFGELALMYSAPRAATITVSSETATLWALERDAFKALLMSHAATKIEPYHGYLKEVEILKAFNKHELGLINELATSTLYDSNEIIVNQGESGYNFFIVEEGTCSAYMAGDSGEKEVKQYNKGDYFGEVALLNGEPRRATVRATGQGCSVLSFAKDDFDKSFIPVFDTLKKSMEAYGAYESFPALMKHDAAITALSSEGHSTANAAPSL